MRSQDKVAIGWADPGLVDGAFTTALFQLALTRGSALGPVIRAEGSGLLSKTRNEIVAGFLDQTDCAWLLMIDSDEILSLDAFDKLIATAHDKSHPIVAGLVFAAMSTGGLYPTPVATLHRAIDGGFQAVDQYPPDRVIEIDSAGTGCLLVHRSVFEAIRADATPDQGPSWCWFQDEPINGEWFGEDVLFCRKAKALGFPIHAHTGAVLPHRKRYWLTDAHHRSERG